MCVYKTSITQSIYGFDPWHNAFNIHVLYFACNCRNFAWMCLLFFAHLDKKKGKSKRMHTKKFQLYNTLYGNDQNTCWIKKNRKNSDIVGGHKSILNNSFLNGQVNKLPFQWFYSFSKKILLELMKNDKIEFVVIGFFILTDFKTESTKLNLTFNLILRR